MIVAALATVGCRPAPPWTAVSPDERLTIRAERHGGRTCVRAADRPEGCFDGASLSAIAFSDTGGHRAYAARIGDRWTIVRDGRAGRSWDGVGAPVLSADGSRLAFAALDGGRWRVVENDGIGPPFDAILDGTLRFDASGRHLAYVARDDSVRVVADGLVSRGHDGVARLTFGPAGRLAYAARRGGAWHVVENGREGGAHDEIGELVLRDGARSRGVHDVAYAARDGSRWRVVSDDTVSEPWEAVRALSLDGAGGLLYVARQAGREAVVHGGRAGEWHDAVLAVTRSADGRWAALAADGPVTTVIVDGIPRAAYTAPQAAAELALGSEGRIAWRVEDGDRQAIVDGHGRHDLAFVVAGTLQYVRDGTVWAALAGDPGRRILFVVADGVRVGAPLDWSELVRRVGRGEGTAALRSWVARVAEHPPRAP